MVGKDGDHGDRTWLSAPKGPSYFEFGGRNSPGPAQLFEPRHGDVERFGHCVGVRPPTISSLLSPTAFVQVKG